MYLRLARLPGVVVCAPSHDDVAGGPILHAVNCRVKARRAPAVRSVVLPQDLIHHVGLAVEQFVETCAENVARAVAVPGRTARGAVARARRHVAGLRRAGGSSLRHAPIHCLGRASIACGGGRNAGSSSSDAGLEGTAIAAPQKPAHPVQQRIFPPHPLCAAASLHLSATSLACSSTRGTGKITRTNLPLQPHQLQLQYTQSLRIILMEKIRQNIYRTLGKAWLTFVLFWTIDSVKFTVLRFLFTLSILAWLAVAIV